MKKENRKKKSIRNEKKPRKEKRFPLCFQMQRTEIHWSPNDRNQLAEIGAEIIIHTFDRPLTGESGKCLSGGTNKKTTNLNYPLNEKSHIKVRFRSSTFTFEIEK